MLRGPGSTEYYCKPVWLLLTSYRVLTLYEVLRTRYAHTDFMDTTLSLFLLVYPIHYWFGAFIADSAPSQNNERKMKKKRSSNTILFAFFSYHSIIT